MKNEILKLISELEARRKSHSDKAISARLADVEYIEYEHIGRERECDFLIAKLWLLLKDESKQPQPPDFANTMLGEVPHEVSAEHQKSSQAVEGATPVVRQNEQIQKVCFRISCFFQRNGLCKHVRDVYEKCGWKQTE